jgi:hypothetical protein
VTPRRVPARSRLLRRSRSIGGLPPIPVAIGLIAAALLGIMLTIALQNSLAVSGSQQGAPMNGDPAPGKNATPQVSTWPSASTNSRSWIHCS